MFPGQKSTKVPGLPVLYQSEKTARGFFGYGGHGRERQGQRGQGGEQHGGEEGLYKV